MQRWLVALAAMVVATLIAEKIIGIVAFYTLSSMDFSQGSDSAMAALQRVQNAKLFSVRLIGFVVCGFLLERRVLLPGLVFFVGFVVWEIVATLWHLSDRGMAVDYSALLSMQLFPWSIAFVGAMLGLLMGQFAARRVAKAEAPPD